MGILKLRAPKEAKRKMEIKKGNMVGLVSGEILLLPLIGVLGHRIAGT